MDSFEDKDHRRLSEIDEKLRRIARERDGLCDLKRDVQRASEAYDADDRAALNSYYEIEEMLIKNGAEGSDIAMVSEQRALLSRTMHERNDYMIDEQRKLDEYIRQLTEQEEELIVERENVGGNNDNDSE